MPTWKAEGERNGNLAEGSGRLKVSSGALAGPYSFKSRFEEGQAATNPEELMGAAHAGCLATAVPAYGHQGGGAAGTSQSGGTENPPASPSSPARAGSASASGPPFGKDLLAPLP